MYGIGLPELIILLVILGIPVGIIALNRYSDKRYRRRVESDVSEAPLPDSYSFKKDPASLTRFLKAMLWIYMAVIILSLFSNFMQLSLLNLVAFSQNEANANDLRQRIIAIVYSVTFIVTGITFLMWIHQANSNSHGFGAHNMRFTPGWSVGYYFIPILNLYRPYQVMEEIWKVSKNPANWYKESGSPLLGWWWTLWITSWVLGQISYRMSEKADTLSALKASTIMSIISDAMNIPRCIVGILLISAIFMQQKKLTAKETYHGISPA